MKDDAAHIDCYEEWQRRQSRRPRLTQGTAREVGLRFPEGVNVVIGAALAGPGLDATHVRVMRPARGSAGRTMGFTVRSRAGVFDIAIRLAATVWISSARTTRGPDHRTDDFPLAQAAARHA